MTASRKPSGANPEAPITACPPRRSFVAGDARRRGQACFNSSATRIAYGAALPTPGDYIARVDNARPFSAIVAG